MSKYELINFDDVEFFDENKEVQFYVSSDDWGSVYAVLSYTLIEMIMDEIKARELEKKLAIKEKGPKK